MTARERMARHFAEHPGCTDGGRAGMCAVGDALYAATLAQVRAALQRRRIDRCTCQDMAANHRDRTGPCAFCPCPAFTPHPQPPPFEKTDDE